MKSQLGIELKNLRKVYPRKLGDQLASVTRAALGRPGESAHGGVALADLTLSIREGERVGIVGPNGAGKSTLLQIIAGIAEPTSGHLAIFGKVTAVLTLGVGLREELTGLENIYLDAAIQGNSREAMEAHVNEIVEFAELGEFINRPLRTYSTGMKARLAFSMITQINPEILIIDEALSVGDAAFSVKAGKRIAQLCMRGVIVLLVSHNMQSVRELCNRCFWLSEGRLIMDGPSDKVTRAYSESVREADEAENIARFRYLVGVRNSVPKYGLTELQMTSLDENITRLVSGAPLSISCKVQQSEADIGGVFLLSCKRLDGALICEHRVSAPDNSLWRTLQVNYPKCNLAPGLYRFQLEWLDTAGSQRAEAATVLEVIAEDVPTGGCPVLLGVGDVESEKIKEGAKC